MTRFSRNGAPIILHDPNQVAEWTWDQLYCMLGDPKELMPVNRELISQAEAIRRGLIPPPQPKQFAPPGRLDELAKAGKIKVKPQQLDPYHYGD